MLRPYRDVTGSRRLTEPYASIDRREGQLPSAGPDRAAQVTRPELARDREGKVGHQVAVHGLRPHLRAEIRGRSSVMPPFTVRNATSSDQSARPSSAEI